MGRGTRGMGVVVVSLAIGCAGDDGDSTTGQVSTDPTAVTGTTAPTTSTSEPTTVGPTTSTSPTTSGPTTTTTNATTDPTTDPTTGPGSTSSSSTTDPGTTGVMCQCDYEAVDNVLVIEAETLPINEEWAVETMFPGYYGDGYIEWMGQSYNNDPTHGVMMVTMCLGEAGRYRLQWRNRIGMGMNATEHNDTWVKFPDAMDYYGLKYNGMMERRVYPHPICDDGAAMMAIESMPQVESAGCVAGSSTDGWLKVYSSGALDWKWSAFTNDNDGHSVVFDIETAGEYTLMMAARGDHHLIDRIVIHEESVDDAVVQDENATETACDG